MSIWHGLAFLFISDAAADVHQAHKEISVRREWEYLIPAVIQVEPWWLELWENHGVLGGSIINVDTSGVWLVSVGYAVLCQRTLNFWHPAGCLWTNVLLHSNEQINHILNVGQQVESCCFSLYCMFCRTNMRLLLILRLIWCVLHW